MRLDKYLKVSRLIKRRTIANEACDAGRVMINDKPAKASSNVKAGDVIVISFGNKEVKVEVPTVATPTVPVTPSVTSQVSNDIFASSSVAATPVNANPVVEPTVQSTVSQSQPEEIESLF